MTTYAETVDRFLAESDIEDTPETREALIVYAQLVDEFGEPAVRERLSARNRIATMMAEGSPMRLRSEAIQLQQKASVLFDEADKIDHQAALDDAAQAAADEVADAEREVTRLVAELDGAIGVQRDSEDANRDAADNFRRAVDAEEVAHKTGSPAEQTEALMRLQAAREVAGRHAQAAQIAQASRQAAEQALTAARTRVKGARQAAVAAGEVATSPGRAPLSEFTLIRDWQSRIIGRQLPEAEMTKAKVFAKMFAEYCGADRWIADEAVRKHEQKRREEQSRMPLPAAPAEGAAYVMPPRLPGGLTGA